MKRKTDKTVTCPNCFGTEYRKVLATPTSRNITDDDSAPAAGESGLSRRQQGEVVRLYCLHCGHELHYRGNRA